MRKISAMYEHSGGVDYRHTCFECSMCVKRPKKKNQYQCLNYGDAEWNAANIACRHFGRRIPTPYMEMEEQGDCQGQMTIFDFLTQEEG